MVDENIVLTTSEAKAIYRYSYRIKHSEYISIMTSFHYIPLVI